MTPTTSNTPDVAERALAGWTVELLRDGQPIRATMSDADGFYRSSTLSPNYATTISYSLRFSAPGASARTALLGTTDSDFTDGLQRIDDIEVQEGSNSAGDLNMPVDPNGVVYDSVSRDTGQRRDRHADRRAQRPARAEQLLRRSEPAGPGDGQQRLLQVRHELLRAGLPERAWLPDRVTTPEQHLGVRACPNSFRRPQTHNVAVRCSELSRLGQRCRAGDA